MTTRVKYLHSLLNFTAPITVYKGETSGLVIRSKAAPFTKSANFQITIERKRLLSMTSQMTCYDNARGYLANGIVQDR